MSQPTTTDSAIRHLWVVDDDELIRELLHLVAAEAGMEAKTFPSGEAVLAHLVSSPSLPNAILCDMQMPGIAGRELAERLRASCGSKTILLAMSGSLPRSGRGAGHKPETGFDGFLLKPFSARQLADACEHRIGKTVAPVASSAAVPVLLDSLIHAKLANSMPPARLAELYELCLSDARKRVGLMEQAAAASNDSAYRAAAHAIKGGCAMVGAVSVARIASEIEKNGLPLSPDPTPLNHLLIALSALERMLNDNTTAS